MESRLILITGPKNSGKTLKAKEISLNFNENEIVWKTQPNEYVSSIVDYYKSITTKKTRLLIFDDVSDEMFLFNLMLLYKYKFLTFENKKLSIIIVCEPNINKNKFMDLAIAHKIESMHYNL